MGSRHGARISPDTTQDFYYIIRGKTRYTHSLDFSKTSTCSTSKPPSWSYAGGGVPDSTEAPVALGVLAGCGAVPAPLTVTSDVRALGDGNRERREHPARVGNGQDCHLDPH